MLSQSFSEFLCVSEEIVFTAVRVVGVGVDDVWRGIIGSP